MNLNGFLKLPGSTFLKKRYRCSVWVTVVVSCCFCCCFSVFVASCSLLQKCLHLLQELKELWTCSKNNRRAPILTGLIVLTSWFDLPHMRCSQNCGHFGYRLYSGTRYVGVPQWDPILGNSAHVIEYACDAGMFCDTQPSPHTYYHRGIVGDDKLTPIDHKLYFRVPQEWVPKFRT